MPGWSSFNAFLAEAERAPVPQRQPLVDQLLRERRVWPWVNHDRATFVYSKLGTRSVALNLDTIQADPPFDPMHNLEGTTLWYVTRRFEPDDLLDYLLAVDDPQTPLATEQDIVGRIAQHWRVDPFNPTRMSTPQLEVSVLRMEAARPFPDWSLMHRVQHGRVDARDLTSAQLNFSGRKVWVYTPPDYDAGSRSYPLLIFQDGQWATGALQLPYIADALIKHRRMQPVVIAMVQSGTQEERFAEYMVNDRHYAFLLTELLPFLQTQYRVSSTQLAIGGVAVGAVAAAHAALRNPAVFNALVMISPPLGRGLGQDKLTDLLARFGAGELLPKRIFQSVGRYETSGRFYEPALRLREALSLRPDVAYKFSEIGSGHGLVGFRSILPEALAWAFPGAAFA